MYGQPDIEGIYTTRFIKTDKNCKRQMPTYEFICECGTTEERFGSIKEPVPTVRCPQCKKQMKQNITGGVRGFMGPSTIGSLVDKNTERMSLDQKIAVGTAKYQELNPLLKREVTEQSRKENIEKEIKKITKGHNS